VHDDDGDDKLTREEDYHSSQVLLYSSLAVATATLLALPGFGFHALRAKVKHTKKKKEKKKSFTF
jgi:hypothetical protein